MPANAIDASVGRVTMTTRVFLSFAFTYHEHHPLTPSRLSRVGTGFPPDASENSHRCGSSCCRHGRSRDWIMNRDIEEMFGALSAAGADYLLIGAHAVGVRDAEGDAAASGGIRWAAAANLCR